MEVLVTWACFDPACSQVEGLVMEGREADEGAIVLACMFDTEPAPGGSPQVAWSCECGPGSPGTSPCRHVLAVAAVHLAEASP